MGKSLNILRPGGNMTIEFNKETFTKRWTEMLEAQKKLDERIIQGNGLTYADLYNSDRYQHALLDELGELNHELKSRWCWWKKTQAPMDKTKVLEEFVDCLHFVLSWQLATLEVEPNVGYLPAETAWNAYKRGDGYTTVQAVVHVKGVSKFFGHSYVTPPVSALIRLMNGLELDYGDVYNAYMAKNQVNHERQDNGY